ncbi:Hypothetical protein HVR_LOCUS93 [uncultured virus]|nr:Hypothetical protein HVR_LOCUS93 [uncultured virus]
MTDQVKTEIMQNLKTNFGIKTIEAYFYRYHVTTLKFIEIIFNAINPTVDSELNIEWFQEYVQTPYEKQPIVNTPEQWLDKKILPSLSIEIDTIIEKEQDDIMTNLAVGLKQLKQKIYRKIFYYIDENNKNIEQVTPWDVIKALTNEKGESLIRLVQFPSLISVKFVVNNTPVPNVYDIDLDQFMGMVLALKMMRLSASTTIFEIITDIDSFNVGLSRYDESEYKKIRSLYALGVTQGLGIYSTKIFKFDNMNFISGFITPFTWMGIDHHKYWTKFTQFTDRDDKTGTDLTF